MRLPAQYTSVTSDDVVNQTKLPADWRTVNLSPAAAAAAEAHHQ